MLPWLTVQRVLLVMPGMLQMSDSCLDDGKHQGALFVRVIGNVDHGIAYVYGFTMRIRRTLLVSDC